MRSRRVFSLSEGKPHNIFFLQILFVELIFFAKFASFLLSQTIVISKPRPLFVPPDEKHFKFVFFFSNNCRHYYAVLSCYRCIILSSGFFLALPMLQRVATRVRCFSTATSTKRVAVILSGCGVYDGTEIHEFIGTQSPFLSSAPKIIFLRQV